MNPHVEAADHVLLIRSRKRAGDTPFHLPSSDDPDRPLCQEQRLARVAEEYDRRDPADVQDRRLCKVCDPDHEVEHVGASSEDLYVRISDPEFGFDDLGRSEEGSA